MSFSAKYLILVFLFPVFLVSCGDSETKKEFCNDNGQQVVQEWFNDKQIKSNITYLDKSGKSYISISYNKSGRMIDSATYINGIITDQHKYYDSGSGLTHVENYKNGVLNGVMNAVFDNGVTSFEGYMLNGSKVGEWKFHYKDGRQITYEFYDSAGNIKYFRKYDDSGAPEKISGSGLIDVLLNVNKSDTNTYVEANVAVASPPDCTTELTILEDRKTTVVDSYNITKPNVKFIFPIGKTGNINFIFNLRIVDSKGNNPEEYSVDKTVKVD